ncbi:MAG: peptidylprolyl isomerase [Candidatus Thorarchaeota archaeon]
MNNPRARLETSKGSILIELCPEHAPKTVENFLALVRKGFYDGLIFHRVIEGFIIQTGCPKGDGTGGPGYTIDCETPQEISHDKAGVVAMAHAGRNTGGSQFYITLAPQTHLDNEYTIFGQVIEGLETLRKIVVGDFIKRAIILATGPARALEQEEGSFQEESSDITPEGYALEPLDEIAQMMNRIKAALEVAGLGELANESESEMNTAAGGAAPVSSSDTTFAATDSSGRTEADLISSRLSEAMRRSMAILDDKPREEVWEEVDIATSLIEEADTDTSPIETSANVNPEEYTIGKVNGAVQGGIRDLDGLLHEEEATQPSMDLNQDQQSAIAEEVVASTLQHLDPFSKPEEVGTMVESLPQEMDETLVELRMINQDLQETVTSLQALQKRTTQIAITVQLAIILLAGITALQIIAMFTSAETTISLASGEVLLGAALLWLIISAALLGVSKILFDWHEKQE